VVPLGPVLHERHTLALDGVGEDADRPALTRRTQRRQQLRVVVAVDHADLPAEAGPLVGQRLELLGVLRARALLQAVAVDDRREVA
jgi:hypothetical protein